MTYFIPRQVQLSYPSVVTFTSSTIDELKSLTLGPGRSSFTNTSISYVYPLAIKLEEQAELVFANTTIEHTVDYPIIEAVSYEQVCKAGYLQDKIQG